MVELIPGTVSPTYEELMLDFLPRPIKTEVEFEAVQREVDRLLDKNWVSPILMREYPLRKGSSGSKDNEPVIQIVYLIEAW